ncbi:cysteine hydrolase [Solwaraspora sp. WMMD1047]|uniref:cysteine hydrolase n=1 Tax=Solwaraspora sp. WMMD1047 TaxID=3016102 RepID=UPI002416BDA1|nr:cysteine hydrolase [Solwaraspora sp. WMMD1047]MDG4828287.1 cysteine hydrolase [Solwaraspora sp. WMMD1047]
MLTGPTIDVYDRQEFLQVINDAVPIIPARSAVLTVEMTERRLTPTAPFPPGVRDELLANTERLLTLARQTGTAVIHVLSALRPVEAQASANTRVNRAWAAVGESPSPYGPVPDESIDVQDGTFEPDFAVSVAVTDYIIKTKKSLSAFYQTDLEWLTKALGVDTLILAGANTNADIQSTAYDASCKAYKVITVSECVATWFGEDLQELGLQQLGRCQGWVLTLAELAAKLQTASTEVAT